MSYAKPLKAPKLSKAPEALQGTSNFSKKKSRIRVSMSLGSPLKPSVLQSTAPYL